MSLPLMRRSTAPSAAGRNRSGNPATDLHRQTLAQVAELCREAAAGRMDRRLMPDETDPRAQEAALAINDLLDVVDAYVRESRGAIAAASKGIYHRRFLTGGLEGSFRDAAVTIDAGREVMHQAGQALAAAAAMRDEMAQELDSTVLKVCDDLAGRASTMGSAASGVVAYAREAVDDAGRATDTMATLRSSSQDIRQAVDLITEVAGQTRMLALNATIEAARAGEYGRGFAVVASEVKNLADEAAHSSNSILGKVEAVQTAAAEAITALEQITARIGEMDRMVSDIAMTIDGRSSGSASAGAMHGDGDTVEGLVSVVDGLQQEVRRFLGQMSTRADDRRG